MWLPGRILHVTPRMLEIEEVVMIMVNQFSNLTFKEKEYDVREVKKCSFDEILISPRMLADHMPNYLDEVTQFFIKSPPSVFSGFQIHRRPNPLACPSEGLAENLGQIAEYSTADFGRITYWLQSAFNKAIICQTPDAK